MSKAKPVVITPYLARAEKVTEGAPREPGMYFPQIPGMDWNELLLGTAPLMIVNRPEKAFQLCLRGIAAIAVVGLSEEEIADFIRQRGGNVVVRLGTLH